jgi:plasmid stabilization system protein ParE
MSAELRLSLSAARQIEEADAWWRENRPASPDLFFVELQVGLARIQRFPTVFAEIRDPRAAGLRRLLLSRSRYYVYWGVQGPVVEVLAVWHASRGIGPFEVD